MLKTQLGQFFTTKVEYILQNFSIPKDVQTIVEPFAGNGDLLNFIDKDLYQIELYDIDPKLDCVIKKDTLDSPPSYDNKFILTNPPYLARNKSSDKTLYDKYKTNDLYKCFIISLLGSNCMGGIMIIPLNFLSSQRSNDKKLRQQFIESFMIQQVNIFEERVFDDTSYAVCAIQFSKRTESMMNKYTFKVDVYPSKQKISLTLDQSNNYTIGGRLHKLSISKNILIERATSKNISKANMYLTNIKLKCIDNNLKSKLGFFLTSDEERYIDNTPKLSARSYATLMMSKRLTLSEQGDLVEMMNDFIEKERKRYNSLFLTNYRESNSIARKRITFSLAIRICSHIMEQVYPDQLDVRV